MEEKNFNNDNEPEKTENNFCDAADEAEPFIVIKETEPMVSDEAVYAADDMETNPTPQAEKIEEITEYEVGKESEFEKELENYLPTPQNTDKVKKPLPQWAISVLASFVTCIFILTLYSLLIAPKIRPAAVISYVEKTVQKDIDTDETISISGINESVSPSIVSISTKSSYMNFFGMSSSTNTGSGVVLSEDGYILTSSSLVGNNGETSVILPDKSKRSAEVIGMDENKDIAILKIEATGLKPVTLGNSDEVMAGDVAIVIGNVLGGDLGTSITKGIICGVNRGVSLQNGSAINLLQTDAITNSNNAGGCLLNHEGHLVGMITYAISANVENISFAIPSNDIKNIAESLINEGKVPEGLIIGITGNDTEHGVLVETVLEDSPAEKAGIKAYDLILKADGTPIKSINELNKIRDSHKKGEIIKITIYRDGEMIDIDVTL